MRRFLQTWAMYGLTLSDAAFFDDIPELRLDQYPGIRRFFRQQPARSTKYITKFYDALEEAVKARRTMRFMDRSFRVPLADELENDPANLNYQQLQGASEHMGAIRREMALTEDAPTLKAVRELVRDVSASKLKPSLRRGLISKLRRDGTWNDLPALKRWLKDDLTAERNKFARKVMQEIREQERGRGLDLKTGRPVGAQ